MKKGLGRGLEALIEANESDEGTVQEVKINDIEPNSGQPRKTFNQEKLEELAESIKAHGIIQPLVVRKRNGKFEIVAGERRWRAARIAGLSKVPIVVKEVTDKELMEVALVENLQREDLNPIEEAYGYETLLKGYALTQEEVSKAVGKSRSAIANTLRLLTLDEKVKKLVEKGELSAGHARAIVVIKDKEQQLEIAKKIIQNDLSVRETEKLLKLIESKKKIKRKAVDPVYLALEDELKEILGTKVRITNNKNKGRVEIEYYSNDDLERIISIFKK